jgi:hypothetical protein
LKRSLLLTCVLCLTVAGMTHADELTDLRAENAKLKAENTQLKQRVAVLEQSNIEIKAQAQQIQQQKHELYLQITPQADGSKTVTSFARQLPLTSGKMRHSTYQFTGDSKGGPITMTIFAGMSPGMFRTAKQLELEVDGTKMTIPVTDYNSHQRRGGVGGKTSTKLYDETVQLQFTPAQIAQLAAANQVNGTLGMAQLGLGREDYNLLIVLAESIGTKP